MHGPVGSSVEARLTVAEVTIQQMEATIDQLVATCETAHKTYTAVLATSESNGRIEELMTESRTWHEEHMAAHKERMVAFAEDGERYIVTAKSNERIEQIITVAAILLLADGLLLVAVLRR
jgi:hypothetical protein